MPRTKEVNQHLREAQREKILEAAMKVFARKGLEATMDDVAAEASVSHGLAYRYFANKEAMLQALIEQALKAPAAGMQGLREVPGTPGERLHFMMTEFVESRRHPEFFQLLDHVLSSETAPAGLRGLVRQRSQFLQGMLRQLIVDGQASGEVAAGDPDQLVSALFVCLEGLTCWATHNPEHYQEHFPDAQIFVRMLKP